MTKSKPRKPDYSVMALNKQTNQKGRIGGAWKNEDESISVILDQFVTVHQDGNLLVTLFLKEDKPSDETPIPSKYRKKFKMDADGVYKTGRDGKWIPEDEV